MKNDDKKNKVRKTVYIDAEIVERMDKKAKKLRRNWNSLAVEQLELANAK